MICHQILLYSYKTVGLIPSENWMSHYFLVQSWQIPIDTHVTSQKKPAYPHDIPWKSLAKLVIHFAPHSCDNPQWTVDVKWVIDSSRPQGDSAFFRSLSFFAIRLCSLWCENHFVVLRWLCFKFDWISSLLILWVWTMIVTMTWLSNQVIHWNWELQWVAGCRPYTGKRLPNAHTITAIWRWFVKF